MTSTMRQGGYQRAIEVVRRANVITASSGFDELLERTLGLFIEVAGAESGTLYLYDEASDELVFNVVQGVPQGRSLLGQRLRSDQGIAGSALQARAPIFVADVARDPRWQHHMAEPAGLHPQTAYCLPLLVRDRPLGVVQVFNLPPTAPGNEDDLALLELLGHHMTNEIAKAQLLRKAQQRERRLSALVDVIGHLTRTLDRSELLTLIMDHARELLGVEATSIWELDERRGLLVLHVATGQYGERLRELTLLPGQGIIGHVVASGETVRITDVREDPRHNRAIDEQTGFVTRSVLGVPLRAPAIFLGGERGELPGSIIGGAQALNKRCGSSFSDEDVALFEAFAGQAATVLQLARLYQDTQRLFMGVIDVVAGAIDAKDPYTQGHSQRVSEFSVAIAEELADGWGLSRDDIYHIKIGGILHDVGKIGVPDAILKKQGRLDDAEFAEIKKHPATGFAIMSQDELAWLLRHELPALLEHHERPDGRGYPRGITAEQIHPIGRIVHVADVFDALTSDRPYREVQSADEVLTYLCSAVGTEFDGDCVAALCRARAHGKIVTQRERNK